MASVRELLLIIRAQNQASAALRSVGVEVGRLQRQGRAGMRWDQLATAGRTMQHFGRVTQYAGLAAGAGIAAAANSAARFNQEVTLTATQTGKIGTGFEQIARNAQQLSGRMLNIGADSTSSLTQINDAAYELFSTFDRLGKSQQGIQEGTRIVKLFSDAAIAGMTDASVAAEGVVAVMSAFDEIAPTAQNTEKVLNEMFAAVRFGRLSFEQLAASLGTTSPAARAANQELETMMGTIAFLSRPLGINKASVGFARLTEILARKKFVDNLKEAGVAITDTSGRMLQLPEVMERITTKFPGLEKGGTNLMQFFKEMSGTEGTIQARRAFVFLAQGMDEYRHIMGQVIGEQNAFGRAFDAMSQTDMVRWQKALNELRVTFIRFGADAIPAILDLIDPILKLFEAWRKLDASTRATIARWAVIATGATLAGSALLYVLGVITRLLAVFGRMRFFLGGVATSFLVIGTAINALRGDWDGLNSVISAFVSLVTGTGPWGWIAFFTAATAAAIKLSNAIRGIAAASAAAGLAGGVGRAGAAGAAGGLLGGLIGGGRLAGGIAKDTIRDMSRASGTMAKLRTAAGGAGLLLGAIPGYGWAIAGAIAAAGGAMLLLKHRTDQAAESAKNLADQQRAFRQQAEAPTRAAKAFEGIVGSAVELKRQQMTLKDLNKEIRDLQRAGRTRQAQLLMLDRPAVIEATRQAYQAAQEDFDKFGMSILEHNQNLATADQKMGRLEGLRRARRIFEESAQVIRGLGRVARPAGAEWDAFVRKLDIPRGAGLEWFDRSIQQTSRNLLDLTTKNTSYMNNLRDTWKRTMQGFTAAGLLPKMTGTQMEAALRVAIKRGRALTIPEIKQVITATTNKRALRRAQADIRAAVNAVRNVDLVVQAPKRKKLDWRDMFAQRGRGGRTDFITENLAVGQAKEVQTQVADIFKDPVKQKIEVALPSGAPAQAQGVGVAIGAGLANGMMSMVTAVRAAADTLTSAATVRMSGNVGAESPARVIREEIGQPIGQGLALGMTDTTRQVQAAAGQLARDAFITLLVESQKLEKQFMVEIALFQGKWLERRQEKMGEKVDPMKIAQIQDRLTKALKRGDEVRAKIYREQLRRAQPIKAIDLQKDLESQLQAARTFNNSLQILARRNVPKELQDQLAELGIEGAESIAMLASMTDKELKRYIKTWRETQKEVRRSARLMQKDIKEVIKAEADELAQTLADKWMEFRDQNAELMGGLFEGMEDKVGQGFQDAMEEYQSSLKDFQDQILDLNQQLVDVQNEAFEQAREEMQQKFGDLFTGTWMTGDIVQTKVEWGQKLGFDDLYKDLQSQVDRFNQWRENLRRIAARVPPELAKQLQDLGPEANAQLEALAGATDEQLADYVRLWQEGQNAINQAAREQVATNQELIKQMNEIVKQIDEITKKMAELQEPKPLTAEDITRDLDERMKAWQEYQGILDSLRAKGVPELLLLELAKLGPEALPYLRALNSIAQEELMGEGGFVSKWLEMQKMIDDSTNKMMEDQIQAWYVHGRNSIQAFVAGIHAESPALVAYFKNLIMNLLKGKAPTGPVAPPAEEYTGPGSRAYNEQQRLEAQRRDEQAAQREGTRSTQSYAATSVQNGDTVNMNVTAVQDESLDSTLERASFRIRNRTKK